MGRESLIPGSILRERLEKPRTLHPPASGAVDIGPRGGYSPRDRQIDVSREADPVLIDLRNALRRFYDAQGFLLGSALSFSFLLCLAPLALLFFSGTGFLLASDRRPDPW